MMALIGLEVYAKSITRCAVACGGVLTEKLQTNKFAHLAYLRSVAVHGSGFGRMAVS